MAVIKRFGVLKMAGFVALYSAFLGLIFGIIFFLISLVVPITDYIGIPGFLSIILFPISYGIMGFLMGIILTPIMNLVLKMTKGINIDLEISGQVY